MSSVEKEVGLSAASKRPATAGRRSSSGLSSPTFANAPGIHVFWKVPAEMEKEMDAFWKEHEKWMLQTHTRGLAGSDAEGPRLWEFFIAKGPEGKDPMAPPEKFEPTGKLFYIMSEAYVHGSGIAKHMELIQTQKPDWFKRMNEYSAKYSVHMDVGTVNNFTGLSEEQSEVVAAHGEPVVMQVWIVPKDKEAAVDKFYKEHEVWMRETHVMSRDEAKGKVRLTHFNIRKGPQLENPMDPASKPTGNIVYVMSETYADVSDIAEHMKRAGEEKPDMMKQAVEYMGAYAKAIVVGSATVFTCLTTKNDALKSMVKNLEFPEKDGMIFGEFSALEHGAHPSFKGATMATLANGKHGVRFVVNYKAGTTEPAHTHTAALEWVLVKGTCKFTNPRSGESKTLTAPAYWFCPGGCPHEVTAITDCTFYAALLGKPDMHPFEKPKMSLQPGCRNFNIALKVPPASVARVDAFFAKHAQFMRETHQLDGDAEPRPLAYFVAKRPELNDPFDPTKGTTENTLYSLCETYRGMAGCAAHMASGQATGDFFAEFVDVCAKFKLQTSMMSEVVHTMKDPLENSINLVKAGNMIFQNHYTVPASEEAKADELWQKHKNYMERTHTVGGGGNKEPSTLFYTITKVREPSVWSDPSSAPTANVQYVLTEVYEGHNGCQAHMASGMAEPDLFGEFAEFSGKYGVGMVTFATVIHTL